MTGMIGNHKDMTTTLRNSPLAAAATAPLYKEVEREILQCLAAGEWEAGDRLPSEPELAKRFGVAVFTLRAGIQKLADSGVLVRRQGKGTYVALHSARPLRNQFLRIYEDSGKQISWSRKLIRFGETRADDAVAETLQLGAKAKERDIYHIECLLCVDQRNIALLDVKAAAHLFRPLHRDMFVRTDESYYAIYQELGGVNVIRTEERVRAALAGRSAAKVLSVGVEDPVLVVDRVAYTYRDVPVEVRRYTIGPGPYHYFSPSSV